MPMAGKRSCCRARLGQGLFLSPGFTGSGVLLALSGGGKGFCHYY